MEYFLSNSLVFLNSNTEINCCLFKTLIIIRCDFGRKDFLPGLKFIKNVIVSKNRDFASFCRGYRCMACGEVMSSVQLQLVCKTVLPTCLYESGYFGMLTVICL